MSKELKLLNRIEELEQALSFYADKNNYGDRGEYWKIVLDGGATARKTLRRNQNE